MTYSHMRRKNAPGAVLSAGHSSHKCRIAKAVYAPASMTDLKVSTNIGMQARHRMPPLQC
jgi:hypothetical protein